MLTVDEYGRIRRAHRDGMSIRQIARTLHHSRCKIRRVLAEPEPMPGRADDRGAAGPSHPLLSRFQMNGESYRFRESRTNAKCTAPSKP